MTQKIAINTRVGGFALSPRAVKRYLELKDLPCYFYEIKFLTSGDVFVRTETPHDDYPYVAMVDLGRRISQIPAKHFFNSRRIPRDDATLIRVIEELGVAANAELSQLKVVEIPDNVKWEIQEGEAGAESIHEKHRVWM